MRAWLLIVVVLAGCPRLPPPDGCTPRATRCTAAGVPQVCSPTQRWTPADHACADTHSVCCATRSPFGRVLHACVPTSACETESIDAAAADAASGDAP